MPRELLALPANSIERIKTVAGAVIETGVFSIPKSAKRVRLHCGLAIEKPIDTSEER